MIIGRQDELNQLEASYHAKGPQVVFVTGEDRVGKTALVHEFVSAHRNGYYFAACNVSTSLNTSFFVTEMQVQGAFSDDQITDWEKALNVLLEKSLSDQIVLAVDDIQYALQMVEKLLTRLYEWKQNNGSPIRMMLILAGIVQKNTLSTLQKNIVSIRPLRITLLPLTYLKAMPYYNAFMDEEKVLLYGITGGYPGYLNLIDATKSFKDNLYSMCFAETSSLYLEGKKYVEEKVRQPVVYHAVLYAIASGKIRLGEISAAVGLEYNKLSKYIGSLLDMGIIERIIPADEQHLKKQHKKTFYMIRNNMLLFWYRFIFPVRGAIRMGMGKKILRTGILSELDIFAQKVFFDICIQYCISLKQKGNFFVDFKRIGYFWKQEVSLDTLFLLAFDDKNSCLMQCLWDKQKVSVSQLQALARENIESRSFERYIIVFSRKGFTGPALQYSAKHPKIRLLSLYYMK